MEDIHLSVKCAAFDPTFQADPRDISEKVMEQIIEDLNLQRNFLDHPEKALKLDALSLRDIPFTEASEEHMKLESDINKFFILLNYAFKVQITNSEWEIKDGEKITLHIPKDKVMESLGNIDKVKALLEEYSINLKKVDIKVIELSPK